MTRRSRIWLVAAVLFTAANFGGAVVAAAGGELLHAATHVVLLLAGASVAWWLAATRGTGRREESVAPAPPRELTDRLTSLAQSLDAVAIEIERIGEWQRFLARSAAENAPPPAPGGRSAAEPIESDAREGAPHRGT